MAQRAGLRPDKEVVFLQSDKLTVKDPEFQAAVRDVTGRLSRLRYVNAVRSPLTGGGAVSPDGPEDPEAPDEPDPADAPAARPVPA
jgi:hypothetical protein